MSIVKYGRAEDVVARMPSPKIWADCPTILLTQEPAKGVHLFDDFKNSVVSLVGDSATDLATKLCNVIGDVNWYAYIDTDKRVDVALQADDSGVLMLDDDGTDDNVYMITTGNNVAGVINTPKKGERKRFWFEARVKMSTVTNTDLGLFVGLAQPGEAKDGHILGALGALAAVDYFGFWIQEADGDDVCVVYNESGAGTAQAVHDALTMVANTWYRIGMRLDVDSDIIKCYVDGVYLGTTYDIDVSSVNFPSDTDMDVLIGISSGATGENGDNLKIDWVRVAQEY